MGDDSFEMALQRIGKPSEMAVPGFPAEVNDLDCFLCHMAFVVQKTGVREPFLLQVCSEEQSVLADELLMLLQLILLPFFQSLLGGGENKP